MNLLPYGHMKGLWLLAMISQLFVLTQSKIKPDLFLQPIARNWCGLTPSMFCSGLTHFLLYSIPHNPDT